MGQAKIMLSSKELELVNNTDWILTKNAIIGKVYALFGRLSIQFRDMVDAHESIAMDSGLRGAKISKGEQYEGLPWAMLDYPRNFSGEDAFSIRCFFWWGHFCSITLHVSGKYRQQYEKRIGQYLRNHTKDWCIGIGNDPWKHHFRSDNYMPIAAWEGDIETLPFIKIAQKISLQSWDGMEVFFEENFHELMQMLATD